MQYNGKQNNSIYQKIKYRDWGKKSADPWSNNLEPSTTLGFPKVGSTEAWGSACEPQGHREAFLKGVPNTF